MMNQFRATHDRFRRYGPPKPCAFKFTHRAAVRNQHVGWCQCSGWGAYGVAGEKEARRLWDIHVEELQAGINREPRVHR